jgi:hypothetical protein
MEFALPQVGPEPAPVDRIVEQPRRRLANLQRDPITRAAWPSARALLPVPTRNFIGLDRGDLSSVAELSDRADYRSSSQGAGPTREGRRTPGVISSIERLEVGPWFMALV